MNPQYSQSGRLKRPTDKFQTYVQESALRRKCKPVVSDSHSTNPRPGNKMKNYSCSNCGFSTLSKSSQDFIKSHHLMKDNRDCFYNGLVHCPSSECDKVFLSDIDMERHCTMSNSSKSKCLQAYRLSKTISSVYNRHATSQVDFIPAPHENATTSVEFGTLYKAPSHVSLSHIANNQGPGNYTAGSHNHNVLMVQGSYVGSSHLSTTDTHQDSSKCHQDSNQYEKAVGTEETNQLELDINTDEQQQFDIPSLGGSDNTSEGNDDLQHAINPDVLVNIQKKIDKANTNSCITREERACISLEELLVKSGSPLYLYDDIMRWAIKNKRRLPTRIPMINRKKLYSGLACKIYGDATCNLMPKEILTTLPSGRRCGLTVFNIYSQITSLLTNHDINRWSNYFFHPTADNPFHINTFQDWESSTFNDIETSIWYQRTNKMVVTDPDNEILVPICLFIDSTVLSLSGSLSLEPVMMSLMIHNRETRKNPDAWLPLGYIHDPSAIVGKKFAKTEDKYADYHSMLSIVLSDLMELVDDTNPGLNWHFNKVPGIKGGITKKLIFRLAFIIGDTKGHDILCGRMGSHNLTPGLCRDCDALTKLADDPSVPCNFIKQFELLNKSIQELRAMSFYRIPYFTFDRLSFGASPYGVNCATAIDIIHGILIGMMQYLYATFVDHLTKNQLKELSKTVSFIATFCSRAIPGFLHCHHFRKGISVKGIMTAKMKLARCFLIYIALKSESFHSFLQNQTGKLPTFVQRKKRASRQKDIDDYDSHTSVQSNNDSVASEHCDVSHAGDEDNTSAVDSESVADDKDTSDDSDDDDDVMEENDINSCSNSAADSHITETVYQELDEFWNSEDDSTYDPQTDFESKDPIIFTDDVYQGWTNLFESMLSLYAWLSGDEMPCSLFKYGSQSLAKHCTEHFMHDYKNVAYRFEGMGLKLTKFHQIRHWYFYISMYGVPSNFDSSFCESHHIHHTKKTGRRTQKRQDELASQTANRVYEGNLLRRALRRCKIQYQRKSKKNARQRGGKSNLRGAKFYIDLDYSRIDDEYKNDRNVHGNRDIAASMYDQLPIVTFHWAKSRNKAKKSFSRMILQSLCRKLAWFNNGDITRRLTSITGYTELRKYHGTNHRRRSIIRAHPDYRGNGYWLDWIEVKWVVGDDDQSIIKLPAQIVMILDFDTASFNQIPQQIVSNIPTLHRELADNNQNHREGIHLLVHSAAVNDDRNADYQYAIGCRYVMEPYFQLVLLENVEQVIFVARDPPNPDRDEMDYGILHVTEPSNWGDVFVQRHSSGYHVPTADKLNLDEFNELYNP